MRSTLAHRGQNRRRFQPSSASVQAVCFTFNQSLVDPPTYTRWPRPWRQLLVAALEDLGPRLKAGGPEAPDDVDAGSRRLAHALHLDVDAHRPPSRRAGLTISHLPRSSVKRSSAWSCMGRTGPGRAGDVADGGGGGGRSGRRLGIRVRSPLLAIKSGQQPGRNGYCGRQAKDHQNYPTRPTCYPGAKSFSLPPRSWPQRCTA
jgi:hypothetical protein